MIYFDPLYAKLKKEPIEGDISPTYGYLAVGKVNDRYFLKPGEYIKVKMGDKTFYIGYSKKRKVSEEEEPTLEQIANIFERSY